MCRERERQESDERTENDRGKSVAPQESQPYVSPMYVDLNVSSPMPLSSSSLTQLSSSSLPPLSTSDVPPRRTRPTLLSDLGGRLSLSIDSRGSQSESPSPTRTRGMSTDVLGGRGSSQPSSPSSNPEIRRRGASLDTQSSGTRPDSPSPNVTHRRTGSTSTVNQIPPVTHLTGSARRRRPSIVDFVLLGSGSSYTPGPVQKG